MSNGNQDDRYWGRIVDNVDTAYERALLRKDEYPGVGMIRPIVSTAVLLGKDGKSLKYFNSSEMSHSGAGDRSSESAICTGGLIKMASSSYPRYSRRPESLSFECNTKLEGNAVEPIRFGLQSLVSVLNRYNADLKGYRELKSGDFKSYGAFAKACLESYPPRLFSYNILGLEQFRNNNR